MKDPGIRFPLGLDFDVLDLDFTWSWPQIVLVRYLLVMFDSAVPQPSNHPKVSVSRYHSYD